ncbi:MAG: MFS transporter [Neisseriaceae bacterium]
MTIFNTISSTTDRLALAAVCLSAVMLGLEITSIPSILPTLEHRLPADFKQLQWVMNAYTLAMCATLIATGALADRYGRKRVFLYSIVVFGLASLICGLASSASLLIGARFIQGLSAAGMLSCQVAILSAQFHSGRVRSVAFAWWGVIFGLGLGFGPLVGGVIVAFMSWPWVFLIHVGIALLTAVLAYLGVSESSDPSATKMDVGGMLTLPVGVFGLVYLMTQGRGLGLADPEVWAVALLSLLGLSLFVCIERRVARPIFDFTSFRIRAFSGALMGASGMNFSFWPFIIYFPIYLQSVLGYSSLMAGVTLLAYTLPTVLMPPYAERLLLKYGPNGVIPFGLLSIAAGFGCLYWVMQSASASWLTLLPGCVLAGIGLGLTNTPVTNTSSGALAPERAGMASGMEFSARMISLSINIAVMGWLLAAGIAASLTMTSAHALSAPELKALVDVIAAGNVAAATESGLSAQAVRDTLAFGFGWVTLYGALAPLVLGLLARLVFGGAVAKTPGL